MNQGEDILSIKILIEQINKKFPPSKYHRHKRLWFRGHANEKGKDTWKLTPGIYRIPSISSENDREQLERHLAQDFRIQSAELRRGFNNASDLYFLQQHYGMPTRLLDWTNSPLAALFFAVSENHDVDGDIYMMDAYELGPTQKAKYLESRKDFKGVATDNNPELVRNFKRIIYWDDDLEFSKFIIPARPNYFDKRITLQRSCFTFHVPATGKNILDEKSNNTLIRFRIPKEKKPSLNDELLLLGIDHFSVFGDLEGLSKSIKSHYKIPLKF
ncbi:MAG: FRG domain-containing protein [Bacteroidota bacterium]